MTWPGLTALVLGPAMGGFITTYASWHWIFFINVPIGILGFILTISWVENIRSREAHPFDWVTFVFAGFASSSAVFAMETLGANASDWQRPVTLD